MDVYMYQADLYCETCAEKIEKGLRAQGKTPEDAMGDSDGWPQGPYPDGGGETDCPKHCGQCGVYLSAPLSYDGVTYVLDALTEYVKPGPVPNVPGYRGDASVLDVWADDLWEGVDEDWYQSDTAILVEYRHFREIERKDAEVGRAVSVIEAARVLIALHYYEPEGNTVQADAVPWGNDVIEAMTSDPDGLSDGERRERMGLIAEDLAKELRAYEAREPAVQGELEVDRDGGRVRLLEAVASEARTVATLLYFDPSEVEEGESYIDLKACPWGERVLAEMGGAANIAREDATAMAGFGLAASLRALDETAGSKIGGPDARVEVYGGVAAIAHCRPGIVVEIIDHDNLDAEAGGDKITDLLDKAEAAGRRAGQHDGSVAK